MIREIQKQIDEMLKNDIIEHSTSEYSFPIVLVKKKNGEFRFAIDYRKLNAVTQPITYPLPRLDDVFDANGQANATIYTKLDLTSAYFQLGLDDKSKHKTAFITHDNLYQFKRMPYGLDNACQSFQALMNQVLRGLAWKHCFVYVFNNSKSLKNPEKANKQALMVRWVYTFLSQNNLSYIFESKSGVIGSFFLIGTDKRLLAPSKICFAKSEYVG